VDKEKIKDFSGCLIGIIFAPLLVPLGCLTPIVLLSLLLAIVTGNTKNIKDILYVLFILFQSIFIYLPYWFLRIASFFGGHPEIITKVFTAIFSAVGGYTIFWIYRIAKYGETRIFRGLCIVTATFLYFLITFFYLKPEIRQWHIVRPGLLSGGIILAFVFGAEGVNACCRMPQRYQAWRLWIKKRSLKQKICATGRGFTRIMSDTQNKQFGPHREITPGLYRQLELVKVELVRMQEGGASRSMLLTYLESTKKRLAAQQREKEFQAYEKTFLQLKRTIEAYEEFLKTERRHSTFQARTDLEFKTEMLNLQAAFSEAQRNLEQSAEIGRLKFEKEKIELTAELNTAKQQAELNAKVSQLEAEKRKLQAELEIERLKKQAKAKDEKASPDFNELKGYAKEWAEAFQQREAMVKSGAATPEQADTWLKEEQMRMRAKYRMKGG
jgi:hypothetical protein